LQRQRRVHELSAAERACPCCGQQREVIGEEVSEQYDCVPQSVFVSEHVRLKYACVGCEQRRRRERQQSRNTANEPTAASEPTAAAALVPGRVLAATLVTAPLPEEGLPKCLAAPGLLAQVIVSTFGDQLPLYRLEQIFARQGVPLSRRTLCDWLLRGAALVTPLCHLMKQQVLLSRVVQSDDTPVPVRDDSRTSTRQGRLWVYVGDVEHPYTVYDYSKSREQVWPQQFLQGYTGYLQVDGYSGYDTLFATGKIVEVGCWGHARRKFYEAQTTDPTRACYALGVMRQLYAIEAEAHRESQRCELPQSELWARRLQRRQEQSVALLTTLCHWVENEQRQVLPKSPIGVAIGYALNQWQALLRYTTQGILEIDNNAAERGLRPVAIGRKN
jgi:transposase